MSNIRIHFHNWMRLIKKKYISKLRYQFIFLLIITSILPILVMQFVNYNLSNKMILKKNASIIDDNLSANRTKAENIFEDYQKLIYKIYTDETFIRYLENFNKIGDNLSLEYSVACSNLKNCINTHLRLYPEVRAIGIYGSNDRPYLIKAEKMDNQSIEKFYEYNSKALFEHIKDQKTSSIGLISPESPYYSSEDPVFYIKLRTLNHENMKYLGGIVLFIGQEKLQQSINNTASSSHEFSGNYILMENGYELCSKDNQAGIDFNEIKQLDYSLNEANEIRTYENNVVKISITDLSYYDLTLVNIVNKSVFLKDLNQLWAISFLIIACILVAAIIAANIVIMRVIKSVERISNMMNIVNEDNLNVFISEKSNNDIRTIETSFNYMVRRVNHLLEENKEQYEHILDITKETHKAELKFLEMQINPHFLFNTIDSINWVAISNGYEEISQQLNNLAWILRHTIYNVNEVVPLTTEIDILKCYLDLQKYRFQNFEYDIFIHGPIDHLYIHKLILQPFIENSILHGFENVTRRCQITIRFFILQNKYLVIKIIDNGIGISSERLLKINQVLRGKEYADLGIGLFNISMRLASYYNNRIKAFASSDSKETCFTLYFPLDALQGE